MAERNLVFPPHTRTRMDERGIVSGDVAAVLAAPVFVRPSAEYPDRDEVYGEAHGRTPKVVVRGSAPVRVVTVMHFDPQRLRRLMAR